MKKTYILGLMLLISFGSIGAVAFTPGLPQIAQYFNIPAYTAELTVTLYLVGYAFGQLLYGPLTNRMGSQMTIIIGALLEMLGSGLCILSNSLHIYYVLLIGRAIMATGAGSGLTLAFIITSKLAEPDKAARIISLLTISFAITPGIGVFIGGLLLDYFSWSSSFIFMFIYGILILIIGVILPEVITIKDSKALNISVIIKNYILLLKTSTVIFGGLLVGSGTCFIYTFAALAPFIALSHMHMSPAQYGSYNFIPVAGMICGCLLANHLGKTMNPTKMIKLGLAIATIGVIALTLSMTFANHLYLSLFLPMFIIYLGSIFIFGNSSALALSKSDDKSNASAMMSFINMGSAVVIVAILSLLNNENMLLLPLLYIAFLIVGISCFKVLLKKLR